MYNGICTDSVCDIKRQYMIKGFTVCLYVSVAALGIIIYDDAGQGQSYEHSNELRVMTNVHS